MNGKTGKPYFLDWKTSFKELSYDCQNCGLDCCKLYQVSMNERDEKRMLDEMGELRFKGAVEYGSGRPMLKRRSDGSCVLLRERMCSIHGFKPRVCSIFPLLLNPASDGTLRVDCTRMCPQTEQGVKVSEKDVEAYVNSVFLEYDDYYPLQASSFLNLTERLSGRHPLLKNLAFVEVEIEKAIERSLGSSFNPQRVYDEIRLLSGMPERKIKLDALRSLEGLLQAGVNAIDFSKRPASCCSIILKDGFLVVPNSRIPYNGLKNVVAVDEPSRRILIDYLSEVARRGKSSQYIAKALIDGNKENVFDAMAYYLFHHASALLLYLQLYSSPYEAIASHDYALSGRIDSLLS